MVTIPQLIVLGGAVAVAFTLLRARTQRKRSDDKITADIKHKSALPTFTRPEIEPVGLDFRWSDADPYYLRPFKGKRNFNPSMGIRNFSQRWEELFLIEKSYLDCTSLRRKYMAAHADKIMYCNDDPRTTEAVREFYNMAIQFMCDRYPQYFKIDEEKNAVVNLINNDCIPYKGDAEDPSELLNVLTGNLEEDILIMLKDNPNDEKEEYILRASLTGSPAGFDPSHNFNKPISAIHGPVPQYSSRLSSPMHLFFNKLEPKHLWMRGNWSIQTNNVLFKLEDHHGRAGDEYKELTMNDIDFDNACFMRCERQLLTRLPVSRANIMLVRTYLTPINQLKDEGLGPELATAIESLPDDLAFYKRRQLWGKAVTEYLRM